MNSGWRDGDGLCLKRRKASETEHSDYMWLLFHWCFMVFGQFLETLLVDDVHITDIYKYIQHDNYNQCFLGYWGLTAWIILFSAPHRAREQRESVGSVSQSVTVMPGFSPLRWLMIHSWTFALEPFWSLNISESDKLRAFGFVNFMSGLLPYLISLVIDLHDLFGVFLDATSNIILHHHLPDIPAVPSKILTNSNILKICCASLLHFFQHLFTF